MENRKRQKAKIATFKFLNHFPASLGFGIYHFLQKKFQGKSLQTKINETERTFHMIQEIANTLNIELFSKRAVEIGSGWLPILPYLLKYKCGVRSISTFDLNTHYAPIEINEFNKKFEVFYGHKIDGEGKYLLPTGIEYFPDTDIAKVSNLRADFVFSRFVLEHVHPVDLKRMHQNFKKSLPNGAYIFHFISPSDHRAYDDPNLSLQDFLKFSSKEWEKQHTKFDYHNRWRLPEYISLFKELDYEIAYLDFKVPNKNSISYHRFKKVKLHPDYQDYSEEDLLAEGIIVVLKV